VKGWKRAGAVAVLFLTTGAAVNPTANADITNKPTTINENIASSFLAILHSLLETEIVYLSK
jgi:hypothetical protein